MPTGHAANHKTNMDLDRRQLLGSLTWAGLASLAAQSRLLGAAQAAVPAFSPAVRQTIASLSDTILPRTATPGAIDAAVPQYIEFVFNRALDAGGRAQFLEDAAQFQADAARVLGIAFPAATSEQQLRYVTALDAECFSAKPATRPEVLRFVLIIKRLVVIGYYTSDQGAHSELDVELLPGKFRGAAPVDPLLRTYYEDSFGVPLERPPGYLAGS